MDVDMKRSTKIAPVSLSTSYLTGSAFIGISITTLNASGTCLPGVTLSRDIRDFEVGKAGLRINPDSTGAGLARALLRLQRDMQFAYSPRVGQSGLPRLGTPRGSNAAGAPLAWRPLQAEQDKEMKK